ncbi:MAG: hypothetical protein ACJ8F7_05220 [Gemmataceae bacterium]
MRFHLRPALTLAAVVALNLAVRPTWGVWYSHAAFALTMLALVLGLAAALIADRPLLWPAGWAGDTETDGDTFLLAAAAVALAALNVNSTEVSYAEVDWARRGLVYLALAGFAATLTGLFSRSPETLISPVDEADWRRHRPLFFAVALVFAAVVVAPAVINLQAGWALSDRFRQGPFQFRWTLIDTIGLVGCLFVVTVVCLLFLRRRTFFPPPDSGRDTHSYIRPLALVLALGLALRGGVLIASPDPVIDVYSLLTQFTDHMLAGRNPYATDIESPYETPRARKYEITDPKDPRPAGYPPHPYLLAAPFRAVGADPRRANVVCDVIAAAALYLVARSRGRLYVGFAAAALWLFIPRTTFMMEQAWYEPMIGCLLGVGLWLAEGAGWRKWLGYTLVGLGLTAKQYGLPILPALTWPHRRNWKQILVGLLAGGLVMLPWFLWSPPDFLKTVLSDHLNRPSQYHRALTIGGGIYQLFGMPPDASMQYVMWAAAIGLIALVSWRGPRQGAAVAVGLGTALLVFCVFHTQGFFNYFYLCQYLWLLGFVGLLAPAAVRE